MALEYMKKIKKSILFFSSISLLTVPLLVNAGDYGAGTAAAEAGLNETAKGALPDIIGNVIGSGLTLIGVLFFILMIYAGILWMTARGKESIERNYGCNYWSYHRDWSICDYCFCVQ